MPVKSLFAAALCAVVVAAVGVGPAFGGEVRGPGTAAGVVGGTQTGALEHAQSICAASGLNHLHLGEDPGRVQSWGQIPKADRDFLTTIGFAPGDSCNGHTGFFAGGGGE